MAANAPTSDTGRLVRCPQCADLLANSRLSHDEREHAIDDIAKRPDDAHGEAAALRFLGKEMLRDPFGFLGVWGQKGSGKSLLLTALVAEFCRRGRQAVYFNADEVVHMLHPGEDKEIEGLRHVPGNPDAMFAYLQRIEVLAIDEIDKLPWTGWQIQRLGALIEYRHRQSERLVTLFSMNKPPWNWKNAGEVEHIGDRLADGRFNRHWPQEQIGYLPACLEQCKDVIEGVTQYYAPGLFELKLPSIRRQLRRLSSSPPAATKRRTKTPTPA